MPLFIFTLIMASAHWISPTEQQNQFVVWNTGQGQWTTLISPKHCLHFDAGGEFLPLANIKKSCSHKKNYIFISHWDLDHINGIALMRNWNEICLSRLPNEKISDRKNKILSHLSMCQKDDLDQLQKQGDDELIYQAAPQNSSNQRKATSNGSSSIYFSHGVLIPGDSTQNEEKKWSTSPILKQVQVLILGHHGSRTSTSQNLLQNLQKVRLAVASARWARYKHPHPETLSRLRQKNIPVLLTEDWGNIHFLK